MAKAKEPEFEKALERLETIVAEMEGGELSLETMIKRFEEGRKLVGLCSRKLNEVERRIEILVKKGDDVEVMILNIDKENRRISLGLKQVQEDPWEHMGMRLPEGSAVDATVVKVLDKGVVVDVGDDVEGFVPLSQIPDEILRDSKESLATGAPLALRVVRLDPQNRRIVLSVKAFQQQEERDEVEGYTRRHMGSAKTTIADVIDLSGAAGTSEEDEDEGESS